MMADHVTNRVLRDKARAAIGLRHNFGAASGPSDGPFNAWGPRQQFRHIDRDAIAVHDHRALGHRQVVRKYADGVFFGGVQFDERATAEPQHLMNGHRCGAEHHGMSTATLSIVATFLPYCA